MHSADTHPTPRACSGRGLRRARPPLAALLLAGLGLAACSDESGPSGPEPFDSAEPRSAISAATSNTWTAKAPMLFPRRGFASATVNGIVYAIAGRNSSGTGTAVEAYDPAANTWTAKAPLPAPRAFMSGAAVINGRIYVPGGLDRGGNATKTLFIYLPVPNKWVLGRAMPVASVGGVSAAIAGKLYVFTPGDQATKRAPALHRFDPATNTWTQLAAPPHEHLSAVGGAINGKFFVAGGSSGDAPTVRLDVYDPVTNSWATKKNMIQTSPLGGSAVLSGKLYVMGGVEDGTEELTPLGTLQVYDPLTDTWAQKADMPTARSDLAVAAANGLLYALGGFTISSTVATNEAYTP